MRFIDLGRGNKVTKAYINNIRNENNNAMINFKKGLKISEEHIMEQFYIDKTENKWNEYINQIYQEKLENSNKPICLNILN